MRVQTDAVLWLKFPDEALFSAAFSQSQRTALEAVFDTRTDVAPSPMQRAIVLAGFTPVPSGTPMLAWHSNLPYFNWTALLHIIAGGALCPVKSDDGAYTFKASYAPANVFRLLRGYWNVTRFLASPAPDGDPLALSIALGFALQALVLQMGSHVKNLPIWLANPHDAPPAMRTLVQKIHAVQVRRTALSHAWKDVLSGVPDKGADISGAPEFFWDRAVAYETTASANPDFTGKGISVCPGEVTGLAIAVSDGRDRARVADLQARFNAPMILVFRYARPETTEIFAQGAGLLFCEGGVLSHACTVAREGNIPAITRLGGLFYDRVGAAQDGLWVHMDGGSGVVTML